MDSPDCNRYTGINVAAMRVATTFIPVYLLTTRQKVNFQHCAKSGRDGDERILYNRSQVRRRPSVKIPRTTRASRSRAASGAGGPYQPGALRRNSGVKATRSVRYPAL